MLQDKRKRWWEQLFGNMYGGQSLPEDATMEQQQDYLRKQAMGASGSALLGASGWSPVPITTGQALADAFGAGRQAYTQGSQDLIAQRKVMAEQQERDRQRAAQEQFLASLPEDQRSFATAMGVGPFAQAKAKQMFAPPKDSRTVLQKEADALFGDDTKAKNAWIMRQRDKPTGTQVTLSMPGSADRLGRLATPEEMDFMRSNGAIIPKGTVLQLTKNGWAPIQGLGLNKSEQELEAEKEKTRPMAEARAREAQYNADRVIADLQDAKGDIGFMSTGLVGQLTGKIGGSPSYNLQRKLDTVKANLGFAELQKMRENSPTGGALGGIAVQELNMLQSTIANLDNAQSDDQLEEALGRVEYHLSRWKELVKKDYETRFKKETPPASGGWSIEAVEDEG